MPAAAKSLERPYPWESSYPKAVSWDVPLKDGTLVDLIDDAVAEFGPKTALEFPDLVRGFKGQLRYSYSELGALVDQVAAGLQAQGVGKGTPVGLFLPNCPYYPIFYFAVAKAGGIVVNFNPLYPSDLACTLVKAVQVEVMVTIDTISVYPTVAETLGRTDLKKLIVCPLAGVLPGLSAFLLRTLGRSKLAKPAYGSSILSYQSLIDSGAGLRPVEVKPDDVAALQFTGGTTGVPKAATLTHSNLYKNCQQVMEWWELSDAERERASMFAILPFYHVFAMTCCLNFMLMLGGKVIMVTHSDRNKLIAAIPRMLQDRKVSFFAGVPTLYTAINGHPDIQAGKIDFSALKYAISGGAALPAATATKFTHLTGGKVTLVEGYGLSETAPIAILNPIDRPTVVHESGVGSIGIPAPGTVVEIINPETGQLVQPGQRGELCISGPQVMQGYWQQPEANAEVLKDGRFRTGDIGVMDENGFFFIVDRLKDMIIVSGLNVYPRDVEEMLNEHAAVRECAVYGVPDERTGEQVNAAVVLNLGAHPSADDLRTYLQQALAGYQVPKVIEFLDELPKSPIGKILKKDLRAAWDAQNPA